MNFWCLSLPAQEYFGKFGELDSVKLKMDPMTGNFPQSYKSDWKKEHLILLVRCVILSFLGRSRGFAFILYKTEEGLDKSTEVSEFSSNFIFPQKHFGTNTKSYPLQVSEHKIKGKSITVKKADVKPGKVIQLVPLKLFHFLPVSQVNVQSVHCSWLQHSGVCG